MQFGKSQDDPLWFELGDHKESQKKDGRLCKYYFDSSDNVLRLDFRNEVLVQFEIGNEYGHLNFQQQDLLKTKDLEVYLKDKGFEVWSNGDASICFDLGISFDSQIETICVFSKFNEEQYKLLLGRLKYQKL